MAYIWLIYGLYMGYIWVIPPVEGQELGIRDKESGGIPDKKGHLGLRVKLPFRGWGYDSMTY
jgi:hypothetical protein